MIPCIERNAVAAQRSVDAARLAKYLRNVKKNRVSFDMVVQTMNLTGKKLPIELKESALGGLAVVVPKMHKGLIHKCELSPFYYLSRTKHSKTL